MRTPLCFGVLLALAFQGPVRGQSVRGMIMEQGSGLPVAGATVQLLRADSTPVATATSAQNGWFTLLAPKNGRYLVRTTHPSYLGGVRDVDIRQREVVSVVLRMARAAIPLEPLVVTARSYDRASGFHERARRGGLGRYITRADIDKRIANRPSDILKMVPEIRLEPVPGAFTSTQLMMRSFGELCAPVVLLDGVPVTSSTDFGFDIDDLITSELIEGIEIYRNYITVPFDLHVPRRECGVIAFWSRGARGGPLTFKRLALGGAVLGAMLLLR